VAGHDLTRCAADASFASPSHLSDTFHRTLGTSATATATAVLNSQVRFDLDCQPSAWPPTRRDRAADGVASDIGWNVPTRAVFTRAMPPIHPGDGKRQLPAAPGCAICVSTCRHEVKILYGGPRPPSGDNLAS
jgi:hypothetical protein